MSVGITVHCDRHLDQWSNCAAQEFTVLQPGETSDQALARLRERGWTTSPETCPRHSGIVPRQLIVPAREPGTVTPIRPHTD